MIRFVTSALAVPPSSVSDNGLGFTATGELAGRAWSGRGLDVRNTLSSRLSLGLGCSRWETWITGFLIPPQDVLRTTISYLIELYAA